MSNETEIARLIKDIGDRRIITESRNTRQQVRELLRLIKGTCIRGGCGKYDETAPNNCSNPGICIYHMGYGSEKLLRHVSAASGSIAEFKTAYACGQPCTNSDCSDSIGGFCKGVLACELRVVLDSGPCGLSCINSGCADWGAGSKCQAVSGCLSRVKEPEGACNEPCVNTACSGSHGALCKSPAACKIQIAPDRPESPEPCNEPCDNGECMNNGEGGKCLNYGLCEDCMPVTITDEPCNDPDLLQDYTLDQWEQIKAGGYFCQFTDDGEYPANGPVQRLLGVRTDAMAPFQTDSGGHFLYCRPAELPGVLRPWFGGECPVDPDAEVFFKDRIDRVSILRASALTWTDTNMPSDIIAYMEVG